MVKDLYDNLEEKIMELGLDPSFKENPAYSALIEEIQACISQMNMGENINNVRVDERNGKYSFEYVSPADKTKYTMEISKNDDLGVSCVATALKAPFMGINGQYITLKEAYEIKAEVENNKMTITNNHSSLDNIDCDRGKCNNLVSTERKEYDENGVMFERESKILGKGELREDIYDAEVNSMLYLPRRGFKINEYDGNYTSRTLIRRDQIDVGTVVSENKDKNQKFYGKLILNGEHGYRDLSLMGYNGFPSEVIIPAVMPEDIENMIVLEKDPRVQEGLRKYAEGRDKFYYVSEDDKNFVCQGYNEDKGMSK